MLLKREGLKRYHKLSFIKDFNGTSNYLVNQLNLSETFLGFVYSEGVDHKARWHSSDYTSYPSSVR